MIEASVPHDDIGKVLGPEVGEEQRRLHELIEVVESVALLQPVELLDEDVSEGRAHLALADGPLREASDEQIDIPNVGIDRLEERQERRPLGGRVAAQV